MPKPTKKQAAPVASETTLGKMIQTIKPLGCRVLVRTILPDETKGGILLPTSARAQDHAKATVIALGPDAEHSPGAQVAPSLAPATIYVGATVLISNHCGVKVKHGGEDHLLVQIDDVLALVV